MSDEYANSGYKGSLVNDTVQSTDTQTRTGTGNYPPAGDTTSSGGYGSAQNAFGAAAQRGHVAGKGEIEGGLIDQSTNGTDLKGEVGDAKQGVDAGTRSGGLNPYGEASVESTEEASKRFG